MALYLDNETVEVAETTLGGAIEAVRQRLGPSGRIVVEVRWEGQVLGGEELEGKLTDSLEGVSVQLVTAEPQQLALQTLEELAAELARARDEQKAAADLLTTDEAATALEHVRNAMAIWQQVQVAVQYIARLMELELDEVVVGGTPLPTLINDLAEKLGGVRDQLMASDWVGLSDTLGYELDESAQQWTELMAGLGERVRAGGISGGSGGGNDGAVGGSG